MCEDKKSLESIVECMFKGLKKLLIPTGTVIVRPTSVVPNGFLECNGAELCRADYSELFVVIGTVYGEGDGSTTFNLPDLRGEFIRGFDNGRGADDGRTIGSWQVATAFMGDGDGSHMPVPNLNNTIHKKVLGWENDVLPEDNTSIPINWSSKDGAGEGDLSVNSDGKANTMVAFARTKPRNIAMMYCIKY